MAYHIRGVCRKWQSSAMRAVCRAVLKFTLPSVFHINCSIIVVVEECGIIVGMRKENRTDRKHYGAYTEPGVMFPAYISVNSCSSDPSWVEFTIRSKQNDNREPGYSSTISMSMTDAVELASQLMSKLLPEDSN